LALDPFQVITGHRYPFAVAKVLTLPSTTDCIVQQNPASPQAPVPQVVRYTLEVPRSIRRLAFNLLRRDKTGIKGKRLQACLKEDYLLRIISQGI